MKMWLCLFCISARILIISPEVITLIKDHNITCMLTGASVYSALYITPYSEAGININRTLVNVTNWVNDDWTSIKSSNSNHDPVTDIRWEHFKNIDPPLDLKLNNKTTSFSVCFNNSTLDLNLKSDLSQYNSTYSQNNSNFETNQTFCRWTHHVVGVNNESFMWKQLGGETTNKSINFTANLFKIDNLNTTMKLHKYDFKYSNSISGHNISYLNISNISNATHICISMFVSLDKGCYLTILLDSNNKLINITENGFNDKEDFRKWKRIEIENSYNETGKLSLIRGRSDDSKNGYWAVDNIHLCKPKLDIYQTILPTNITSKDAFCKVLNVTSQNSPFCDKPGYLGQNCSINCTNILGKSFPFCEKHMICLENNTCQCAWGFQKPDCKESCGKGYWGLSCTLKCNEGCECDSIKGCTKCKKQFFGNECSDKFPVLLQPPHLYFITEDTLVVGLGNIQYGSNEKVPNFYQLQYKKTSEETYINCSSKQTYSPNFETINHKMTNMSTTNESYNIRIILLVDDEGFVENSPVLTTYKKSLTATNVSDENMTLQWSPPNGATVDNYTLEYECDDFCSNVPQKNNSLIINKTTARIENLKLFKSCNISLFLNIQNGTQLIDQTAVPNTKKEINESELPINITLKDNKIVIELDNCSKFSGPLHYHIKYKCTSKWCNQENKANITIPLTEYNKTVEKEVKELTPFTEYEIEVTAERSGQNWILNKNFTKTTPSSKPHAVENLSLYCSNNDSLLIRWQEPYPRTGTIESYNITYPNFLISNYTTKYELWDNFLYANITGLESQTTYNISVQAKNYEVSQWSDPTVLTNSTKQKAHVPENITIHLTSEPKMLNLTWNHPPYTNHQLKKMYIKTNNETHNLTINKCQRSYNLMISVEAQNQYNISVWGVNGIEGDKVRVNATIFPPISEFSPNNFVEWCSERCYLLVPKPNQYNVSFEVMVMKNKESSKEKLFERYCSLKNRSNTNPDAWMVKIANSRGENEVQLEIGQKEGEAVSIKNSTCIMYLVLNESKSLIFLIQATDLISGNVYKGVLISSIVTIIVVLLLGFLYYMYIHKRILFYTKQRHRNHQNVHRSEDVMLLEVINKKDKSTIVQLQNLENYVKDSVLTKNELIKQFKSLPAEKTDICSAALKSNNINKNKDKENVPYNFNRVILKAMEGVGRGDYINANYVDGFHRARAYIVSQEPKFYTIRDFWRMIWQKKVETVIMATNFIENKKRLCAEYWAEDLNTIFKCADMKIKLIKKEVYEHYDHRIFEVHYKDHSRQIQHFQLRWSLDSQVPFYPNYAVPLVKRIRGISKNSSSPILIHSSLGVNRTGTLLLCDLALQMITVEESVDFYALLKRMREQRSNMVNNVEYYTLAHLIVLECIMEQNTPFKEDIEENMNTFVIKEQLNYLERLCWHDTAMCSRAVHPRNQSPLCPIFVDGYKKDKTYLVTKEPTKETVVEFWVMAAEENVSHILFLNVQKNKFQLWPRTIVRSEVVITVRPLYSSTRSLDAKHSQQYYKQTQLLVTTYTRTPREVINESKICFLELNGWKSRELVPTSADNILDVINYLTKIPKNKKPILVACRDGINASGLFTALSYVIDKYENEMEFDVCNALRIVRRSSAQFMNNHKQVKFLYKAILEYKKKYDKHAYL